MDETTFGIQNTQHLDYMRYYVTHNQVLNLKN